MPPPPIHQFNLRKRITDRSLPPLVIQPVTLADPAIVEIAGFAGIEAVLLDCEHGMIDSETVRSMFAHAQAAGIAPVFRPRSFDSAACRQALDQGAAGVHVAHIDSEDEAREVVAACRYAPLGRREMSLGRAIGYEIANLSEHVANANDHQLLTVMIESLKGLENNAGQGCASWPHMSPGLSLPTLDLETRKWLDELHDK